MNPILKALTQIAYSQERSEIEDYESKKITVPVDVQEAFERFLAAAVVRHLQKLMGAHGSCSKQNKASPLAPSCNVGELGFLLTCSSGPAPWPRPDPSRPRVFKKKTKKQKKTLNLLSSKLSHF